MVGLPRGAGFARVRVERGSMRALVAPNDYKGTLTAVQAARALGRGARAAGFRVDALPLADGGPGTAAVLRAHHHGRWRRLTVPDPLGRAVVARWADLGERRATFDAAEAVGLARLPARDRDPMRAHTVGVGILLRHIAARGFREIFVGLGGTATVDGGLGLLLGLGGRVRGREPGHGEPAGPADPQRAAGWLRAIDGGHVSALDLAPARKALADARIVALTDVSSPLAGPAGAAAVFAPQKGARPEDVPMLDARLRLIARLVREAGGFDASRLAGAGAAGGLGFMLRALGARLVPGADHLMELAAFDERARAADVVITGEGQVDGQTVLGKLPWRVALRARRLGRPTLIVAGRLGPGHEACESPGWIRVAAAAPAGAGEDEARARAAEWLEAAAAREQARMIAPD